MSRFGLTFTDRRSQRERKDRPKLGQGVLSCDADELFEVRLNSNDLLPAVGLRAQSQNSPLNASNHRSPTIRVLKLPYSPNRKSLTEQLKCDQNREDQAILVLGNRRYW